MSNSRIVWAIILIVVGIIGIGVRADLLNWPFRFVFHNLLSIGLVALGIYLIVRQANRRKAPDSSTQPSVAEPFGAGFQTLEKVFGDMHFDARDIELNGRNFSTVFGDILLYLSGGRLSKGNNRISATTVFGDVTITLPKDMAVFATGSDIFGEIIIFGRIASGISNSLIQKTENFDSAQEKLYIHARTVFGDVRIFQV